MTPEPTYYTLPDVMRAMPEGASRRAGAPTRLLAPRPGEHNGAYRALGLRDITSELRTGEKHMRLILGIIIGCALTVGGAYVADAMAPPAAGSKMVNWDVVAKNLDTVATMAREGWKKITG